MLMVMTCAVLLNYSLCSLSVYVLFLQRLYVATLVLRPSTSVDAWAGKGWEPFPALVDAIDRGINRSDCNRSMYMH